MAKKTLKNKIKKAKARTRQWARGINIKFPGEENKKKFYGKSFKGVDKPLDKGLGLRDTEGSDN
jgi:hypothetical protein